MLVLAAYLRLFSIMSLYKTVDSEPILFRTAGSLKQDCLEVGFVPTIFRSRDNLANHHYSPGASSITQKLRTFCFYKPTPDHILLPLKERDAAICYHY